MKQYYNVYSTEKPDLITIDEFSVWIAQDICKQDNEWSYTLTQYSKDEYIQIMDNKNAALDAQLTDTQLALCDVYEMIGG